MTTAPCDQAANADQEATGRLRELYRELDLWGIVTDDLAPGTPAGILNLPGTRCGISSPAPGTLTLAYQPRERDLRPYEDVCLALAPLDANGPWIPVAALVPDPELPPAATVSRGMTVEPAQDGHRDEATAALLIFNRPSSSRGRVTIGGGHELRWERRFAEPDSPGPGLSSRYCPRHRGGTSGRSRGAPVSGPHRKATVLDQGGYPVSSGGGRGPRQARCQRHVTRTRRTRDQAVRRLTRKAAS